jgi:hypothetical protein
VATPWAQQSGFDSGQRQGIFLFSKMFRSALRLTQHPAQWVPDTLSLAIKGPGHEVNHSPQLVLRLSMSGAILLAPLYNKCTNPRCQVTWATRFCTVVPNICWTSVWNWLHATLLVPVSNHWPAQFDVWENEMCSNT